MFAGSLVFETPVDTKGVETGAKKIEGEFGGLKNVANETGKAIKDAFSGDFSKPIASAQARINDLLRQLETVSVSFKEAIAADDDSAAEKYGRQRIRIYDQIEAAREKLSIAIQEASQKQAEAERKAAEKSEKAYLNSYSNMRKSFSTAERTARRFGRRLRSIISGALVFNLISSGLRGFTSYLGSALKTNKEFTAQLAKLKGALLTAFQPIYTYVLPFIVKLMQYLTSAANAVAYFFSILTGSSNQSSAKAAENLYNEANAIGAVGGAAKKAKKALAGFDELNVLPATDDEGAGGGSSSVAPDFSGFENSALSKEMETVMGKLKTIAGYIPVIAAGLAGLKLGSFLADLLTANTEAKTLKETIALLGKKAGLAGGITLSFAGIALETKGIISTIQEGLNGINFAEILGGGGMLTGGGALIGQFFGSALIGGAVSSIIAGIPMFITGIYDAVVNGLNWLNGILIPLGSTLAATGIGVIVATCIGSAAGPVGAGIGALIGLVIGLLTDFGIWFWQKFDEIEAWFEGLPVWGKSIVLGVIGGMGVIPQFIIGVIATVKKWDEIKAFAKGVWESISSFVSTCWDNITEYFSPAVEWFSALFNSVRQTISDIFYNIGVIASGCWEVIKVVWGIVSSWFNENVVQPVAGFFTTLWDDFVEKARTAWEGVKTVFGKVASFFSETFQKAWAGIVKVFSVAGEIFNDIKDGILTAFKSIVNGLIKGLNSAIAVPFNGINTALRKIRDINIAGLSPFSALKTVSVPSIPYLAQGAVLPPNKPFMAVVGDQKHGTNIEAPLSTIQEAVALALEDYFAGNMAGHEAVVQRLERLIATVENIEIGDSAIGEAVLRYNRKMAAVRGV